MKKYYIDNECMRDLLMLYCEGKSLLWNTFFGWRGSSFKNGEWVSSIYRLPERAYHMAMNIAKKYGDYEIL